MNATTGQTTASGPSLGAALLIPGGGSLEPGGMLLAAVLEDRAQELLVSDAEAQKQADEMAAHRVDRLMDEGRLLYGRVGRVAVIPVMGSLVRSFPYVGYSERTGYDTLELQIAQAMTDPEVGGVAFWIDSPGGHVAGLYDLTTRIEALRDEREMPMLAALADEAYSAAYAIAVTADQISVPPMGGLGSIGALGIHVNMAGMLEKLGIGVTLFQAGKRKTWLNPFEPPEDEASTDAIGRLEEARSMFAALVGRSRARVGSFPDAAAGAAAAMASEAGVWRWESQVNEAVQRGFADAVMRPDEALQQFVDAVA